MSVCCVHVLGKCVISDMVAMGEKPGQEPWEGLQGKPSRQKEGHRPVSRGNSVGKRSRKG